MRELSDEDLLQWKELFSRKNIFYDSDDDYREAAQNLVSYFDILLQMDQQQKAQIQKPDSDYKRTNVLRNYQ